MSEGLNWLFNVTINDILDIHVTAQSCTCRCAGRLKKKLDLTGPNNKFTQSLILEKVQHEVATFLGEVITLISNRHKKSSFHIFENIQN